MRLLCGFCYLIEHSDVSFSLPSPSFRERTMAKRGNLRATQRNHISWCKCGKTSTHHTHITNFMILFKVLWVRQQSVLRSPIHFPSLRGIVFSAINNRQMDNILISIQFFRRKSIDNWIWLKYIFTPPNLVAPSKASGLFELEATNGLRRRKYIFDFTTLFLGSNGASVSGRYGDNKRMIFPSKCVTIVIRQFHCHKYSKAFIIHIH